MPASDATSGARFSLLVMNRGGVLAHGLPSAGEVVLGRGDDCDVRLEDSNASRRHARLRTGEAGVRLADLGSLNGTVVGGRRLPANEEVTIDVGDFVTIGETVLVLQTARTQAPPLRLRGQPAFDARLAEEISRTRAGHRYAVVTVTLASALDADDLVRSQQLELTLAEPLEALDVIASVGPRTHKLLLPGRSEAAAREIAARIRKHLSEASFEATVEVAAHPSGATSDVPPPPDTRPATIPAPAPDEAPADERGRILAALERAGGDAALAAKLLGVSARTFAARLAALDITRPE